MGLDGGMGLTGGSVHLEIDVVCVGFICGLFILCLVIEAISDLLRSYLLKRQTQKILKILNINQSS